MVMVRSWNTLCVGGGGGGGGGWEGGYHLIILGIQPWTTDVVFTESMLNIPLLKKSALPPLNIFIVFTQHYIPCV